MLRTAFNFIKNLHSVSSNASFFRINYRRFFTVNSLICLNIQNPVVFEHVHEHAKNLLKTGVFQGLRVDHIDGLHDPSVGFWMRKKALVFAHQWQAKHPG
ncbi:hypothetical protein [Spirosoma litoris]